MEILEKNPERYKEIIDISESLMLKDSVEDIIKSICKNENLTSSEKIYVAYFTGYRKCHQVLWHEFKNKVDENMRLKEHLDITRT
jgi:hypothetical protein